ncbi:unnamed protein product [Peronospora farinosa]|uniref:Uncharacterized protein n=1 Tax=Peronospora farinosa TaxID=134698 RepID=A0AAV0TNF1_9STRA|nr:unnamed protein product [Peronospora farinosa]
MVEQKVFQRHEAHEIATPLLMLRVSEQNNITLNAPPNASMMLDGNDVSVLLPFDLTERLTRFVARQCFSSEVLPIRPSNPEEQRCRAVWVPTVCASMTLERRATFLTFPHYQQVLVARCNDYLRTKFYSMCTLAHLSLKLRV